MLSAGKLCQAPVWLTLCGEIVDVILIINNLKIFYTNICNTLLNLIKNVKRL